MNIQWNAGKYKESFGFVPAYGEDVMGLLTVAPGSAVVDLGCGNGTLTKKLAERGYRVSGVDASAEMIALARTEYPEISFAQADAREFTLPRPADAVFSNAVFHWIDAADQDAMLRNIAAQLRPGGELVCEFGGCGCAEAVHSALETCFARRRLVYPRVFYFPSIGEYAPKMERQGLRVEYAVLFDRPTPQKGENGLLNWINMFVQKPFEGMDGAAKQEIIKEAEEMLRPVLLSGEGVWMIDYVRIRLRARKVG